LIDVKEVIGKAISRSERKFPDGDSTRCEKIYLVTMLYNPACRSEKFINFLTRLVFWLHSVFCPKVDNSCRQETQLVSL